MIPNNSEYEIDFEDNLVGKLQNLNVTSPFIPGVADLSFMLPNAPEAFIK